MNCPKCGKEISDDAIFCVFCGSKIIDKETNFQNSLNGNVYENNEFTEKIKKYNDSKINIKKKKNSHFIIITVIILLIVGLIAFINTKMGIYLTSKFLINVGHYELAANNLSKITDYKDSLALKSDALYLLAKEQYKNQQFELAKSNFEKVSNEEESQYKTEANIYFNYIDAESDYKNSKFVSAGKKYEECLSKVGKDTVKYYDIDFNDLENKYNFSLCKSYQDEWDKGELYEAFKILNKIDSDYVYEGVSVENIIDQLSDLKNYIELTGQWTMTKSRAEISPSNRYLDGWYNNSSGGSITIDSVKNGTISVSYNLPYIQKYSVLQSGLKYGYFTGTVSVSAADCNQWRTISAYSSENLQMFIDVNTKVIYMKFRYGCVLTSNDVILGNTSGEYQANCITNMSSMLKNGWIGDYYYVDGKKLKNAWAQYGTDWYYMGADGNYLKNQWCDNNNYYVGEDGKMLINTSTPDGRYVDAFGKKVLNLSEKIEQARTVLEFEKGSTANEMVGITFGTYPQNGNKDPIEWLVLRKDSSNRKALLVSKYILDNQSFNSINNKATWENSSLKAWLNNGFYDLAFSDSEKSNIILSNTSDNVFVLNKNEVEIYMDTYGRCSSRGTTYAKKVNNGNLSVQTLGLSRSFTWAKGNSPYWLRSKYNADSDVYVVDYDGKIKYASMSSTFVGVRPAIWVRY